MSQQEMYLEWKYRGWVCKIFIGDMRRALKQRGIDGLIEMVSQVKADEQKSVDMHEAIKISEAKDKGDIVGAKLLGPPVHSSGYTRPGPAKP